MQAPQNFAPRQTRCTSPYTHCPPHINYLTLPTFHTLHQAPCGELPTPLVDGQTSWVYPNIPVQSLYISCSVTANKLVLSYLLLRWWPRHNHIINDTPHHSQYCVLYSWAHNACTMCALSHPEIGQARKIKKIFCSHLFIGIGVQHYNWTKVVCFDRPW